MPDGFEKQLSRKELTDLLEFLTQRGKYLPLPLDKVATVVSTRGMFYSEEAPGRTARLRRLVAEDLRGVPFQLVDPQGERVPNVILLYGPEGKIPPKMPKSVTLPCNAPAKAIHLLSGVSGWGYPYSEKGSVYVDRPPALRGRQDGGPRAPERRALRGLHPPGGRAGLEVRLRAAGQAGSLSRHPAGADGEDHSRSSSSRARTGRRRWSWR